MIEAGNGKYRVWLKETEHGEDIILFMGGGEKTHIGSVVICEPGKKPITNNLGTHKDWIVAEPIAKKMCEVRGKTVVCIAGIHVDKATDEDIEKLKENCMKIEGMIK